MRIRLKKDWRGYRRDSVLIVGEQIPLEDAEEFLKRGLAMRAKPGDYMRHLGAPPQDKMMRGAPKQK
jgi:hypothetical protein